MSQNFKRSVRLLKKVEFQEVKKSSNKTRSLYFWGQARVLPSTCLPKLGIITTRRLGPAHERNRARRLVRELFRKNILIDGMINLTGKGARLGVIKFTDAETDKSIARIQARRADEVSFGD